MCKLIRKVFIYQIWVFSLLLLFQKNIIGQASVTKAVPPMEVYIIDQEKIPVATGKPGTTYTASIYIIDNINKKVLGPYRGSSFPNSKQSLEDKEKPNTLKEGLHIFNNKYGHKGGTQKGLNLINSVEERKTDAWSWTKKPSIIVYANVHTGFSDKGNYNSRGSEGCITLHPSDVNAFFANFDFSSSNGFTGKSNGTVFIYRANSEKRKAFIDQIKKIY